MPAPALEMVPQRHAHWMRLSSFASVYGLSCGRCRYLFSVQRDCVPRNVFMSHSTSMPSAWKKPSCWATKSLMPMPLGATRTFLIDYLLVTGIVATIHDDAAVKHTNAEGGIGSPPPAQQRKGSAHPPARPPPIR